MSERRLESENIDSSLYRVRRITMPQLVWMNVEARCSSPFTAYISKRLSSEMSLSAEAREYIAVSFATAERLKKLERVTGHSNSPCFASFAEEVNLASVIECLDVFPTDSRNLGDPATQKVTPLNQGVITP